MVYTIGARQFQQQILPEGLPATTVWGYGSAGRPETFHYPGYTIEARYGEPVTVRWANQLVDGARRYLPHLVAVDPTLHWANPPGGVRGRDSRPDFTSTPGPYTGPVPLVTHLHGGRTSQESDGYPEAWYLPNATDIPQGYATTGSFYDRYKDEFEARWQIPWTPGTAVFRYDNRQRATTLWYHDHALGLTGPNVYAGLAGFYLLRGGPADLPPGTLPGPAPGAGDGGGPYFEIPLVIQDRTFRTDGGLAYPAGRAEFDGFTGPYIPDSDIPPIWTPESFGTAMVSNGRTWPALAAQPRRYRLRILNGCGTRTLILKITSDPLAPRPAAPALPFWQIGNEGGFLPAPHETGRLLLAPAERADVIADFTGVPAGTALYLINEGPDAPFQGGTPGTDFPAADPATTGQVMKFEIAELSAPDTSTPPDRLELPPAEGLVPAIRSRRLSLNEEPSAVLPGVSPARLALGGIDAQGRPVPRMWGDPVTETPRYGDTEVWEFHNFTVDAHPIHLHAVHFEVVGRQPFGGTPTGPEPGEAGFKDTVIAYPDMTTTVKATFDVKGRFVWHCHMLGHEDNEMMRPYTIR
ncbi:multicopper oxidase family protein [Nocardiopsis sediminis]|uniref:Multicopper oxidase family protein n=1 Tax=Nocardiopsis sediminis TaxID=1778267 RepID=A0ABV8FN75_9ACTN